MYIYGITTTGKDWRYIIFTSENKIYKGIPQLIDLDSEKLRVPGYKDRLKESVETMVKTIAWMLDSQVNAKTTSKRQRFDALLKPKVDIEEELSWIEGRYFVCKFFFSLHGTLHEVLHKICIVTLV